MWDMILTISQHKSLYARVTLAREVPTALEQARNFATRFPVSEGYDVKLYQWENHGELVDFSESKQLPEE